MDTNYLLELLTIALVILNQHTLVVLGVLFLGLPALLATEPAKRKYDIPAGDASETLSELVEQSDEQIFFLVDRVRGYNTKAVKGAYSINEALAHMLKDSQLFYVTDEATGAVMVRRIDSNQPDIRILDSDETPSLIESTEPQVITQMKQTNSIFKELLTGLFGLALVGSSPDLVGQ
ncbi:MAG: STN domain-containing protein, partial [Verrucomicrobia bacterium]|nr:STN domain-containing protein [Verrucomicrobiota bacterium]